MHYLSADFQNPEEYFHSNINICLETKERLQFNVILSGPDSNSGNVHAWNAIPECFFNICE